MTVGAGGAGAERTAGAAGAAWAAGTTGAGRKAGAERAVEGVRAAVANSAAGAVEEDKELGPGIKLAAGAAREDGRIELAADAAGNSGAAGTTRMGAAIGPVGEVNRAAGAGRKETDASAVRDETEERGTASPANCAAEEMG